MTYEAAERLAIRSEPYALPQSFDPTRYANSGTVVIGDHDLPWSVWDGQQLRRHFAIDTETTLIEDHRIPDLAMVSVSDGMQHYVLKPHQLPELLGQHLPYGHHLTFCNVAFDFWVIDRYLAIFGAATQRSWLWSAADENRLHDTMLLAGLVGLAESDQDRLPSLATAVEQYCGYTLEKDEYRTRYAETIGADWTLLDPGFFQYAVSDAIATYQLYCRLTARAKELTEESGVSRQFGFLTEAIQVKAAISLAAVTRYGIHLDLDRADQLRAEIDQLIQQAYLAMQKHDACLFHRYKDGRYKRGGNGRPKMDCAVLAEHLKQLAQQIGIEPPVTATGKVTTSTKVFWNHYRDHPLVDAYCSYKELTKLRTFLDKLDTDHIHPHYRILVRSGRTSCSSPNIQQLPRSSNIREIVTASPGHILFIIDYSALELRTLAAVCQERYGFSRLREVLRAGIDPHSYTAAMFAGVDMDAFAQLSNHKQLRQRAKAINFGFPGGLGAAALVSYAKQTYGVTITQEEAAQFRTRLTEEVYPELRLYLNEDSAAVLARPLHVDPLLVRQAFPKPYHFGMLKKITEGSPVKADGTPYAERTIERTWQQLEQLNRNQELAEAITTRDTSNNSPLRRLMYAPVTTATGRLRGGVSFTAARNTPFQGLAADGAKLAMWELLKAGYRVVAFVHDEFLIELSKLDNCTVEAERISSICCDTMGRLVGDIPVTCSYALAERWYKQAEAVYDHERYLLPWVPEEPQA